MHGWERPTGPWWWATEAFLLALVVVCSWPAWGGLSNFFDPPDHPDSAPVVYLLFGGFFAFAAIAALAGAVLLLVGRRRASSCG